MEKFSTLTAFAHALGTDPQSLNNYLTGKIRPGNKMKFKLRELGANIDWIMEGDTQRDNSSMRPVYASVPAGNGRINDMPYTYEEAPPGVQDNGKGYWLKVKGDSMYPALRDGQLVFINPEKEVNDKDFAVVIWDEHEEGAIKQVHFNHENVILLSVNPSFEPVTIARKRISLIARICYIKL